MTTTLSSRDTSVSRFSTAGIGPLFFLSGGIALVYEVLWQRQFALVLGSAAPATAAVLAAYFAGLGLGGWIIGAWANRWKRPLRVYAILEVAIAGGAVLVSPILGAFEGAYPWLVEHFGQNNAVFFAGKTGAAFLSIAIPTLCMGGTLPVLAQLVDDGARRFGLSAGFLYAANTFGATLGALAAPFLLLLHPIGANSLLALCIAINLLVAAAAWLLDWRWVAPASVPEPPYQRSRRLAHGELHAGWVLWLSFLSGLAVFALQVLWNRAFAQVHENSIYSFSAIAAMFIFALALGAQVARVFLRRGVTPERLVAWAWMLGGVLVAIGPCLFLKMTHGLAYLPTESGWSGYAFRLIGLTAAVLAVPIGSLGIVLPALMEQAGRTGSGTAGSLLGRLLAVNIAGSVAGALLAGFALPHWLGLWKSIVAVAALLLLSAGGLFQRKALPRGIALAAAALGVSAPFFWDMPRVRVAEPQREQLIHISEGAHGIVAVVERAHSRRLKLNNYYTLGGSASMGDERMQAHLPLLLHPTPQRVAFLGLGTGVTASGALFHPSTNIVAMELVPEVIEAARLHFRDVNAGFVDHPRARVVAEDARNFLRGTREKFDVIIGDLVVPWRQGEGALFTLEQFQAARSALAPGGLFCQWLPLFQLSEVETQILLRTFLTVFPNASVWRGDFSPDQPAMALIGAQDGRALDPTVVARRLKEMQLDPSNPHLIDPAAVWMHFVGILSLPDVTAGEARINSENRPWIELIGPLQHGGHHKESLFIGRRLQQWTTDLKAKSVTRLPQLSPAERRVAEAGDLMTEFTLLFSEGKRAEAQAVQAKLKQALPETVFKAMFP